MKTLLVSLPYGMAFRSIVCCGVLDACLRRGDRVTVLLPALAAVDAESIRGELPEDVGVETLSPVRSTAFFAYLKAMKQYAYYRRTRLESFRIRYAWRRRRSPLVHALARAAEGATGLFLSERSIDRMLARARQPHTDRYIRIIERTGAEVVVIAKPGYQPEELPLIKASRRLGVPVISVDTSWDNMGAKRPPYILPDALTVWNDRMFREAVDLYGFRPDRTAVTGGAPFDVFGGAEPLPERDELLRRLGLDPSRKLILFTLNHLMFAPDNHDYIKLLLSGVEDGRILGGPNVVVRVHPWDRKTTYDAAVRGRPRTRLEKGFGTADRASVYECIPSRADVLHYGALVTHADVLVNVASTTSLDALAAGTPIANVAFETKPTSPEMSPLRLYELPYYRSLVESGAVRITRSPGELFSTINAYLADRALDSGRREAARKEFLTFSDGRSAERVASTIGSISDGWS